MNKIKKIHLLLLCLSFHLAGAQEKIALYEQEIPNHVGNPLAESELPHFFVYKPNVTDDRNCAILIIPGGGYGMVAIDHEGHQVAKELTQVGYTAFVLKYRLPSDQNMKDKKWGPLQDAQAALARIRGEYGFSKAGVLGFSAGGHLAGTLLTLYNYPQIDPASKENIKPDFGALLYPVVTMGDLYTHKGSKENLLGKEPSQEDLNLFSIEKNINKNTPPIFIMHARDDQAVPFTNATLLDEALTDAKVRHELFVYEKGGHGFGLNNSTSSEKWIDALLLWLDSL